MSNVINLSSFKHHSNKTKKCVHCLNHKLLKEIKVSVYPICNDCLSLGHTNTHPNDCSLCKTKVRLKEDYFPPDKVA